MEAMLRPQALGKLGGTARSQHSLWPYRSFLGSLSSSPSSPLPTTPPPSSSPTTSDARHSPNGYKIQSMNMLSEVLERVHHHNEASSIAVNLEGSGRTHTQFPAFISSQPTFLNLSLLSLFKEYQTNIVSKICYNLLVSNAVPNLKTYNILIKGFARLRQPSFAILFFRSLLKAGLVPDRYTFIALMTLFATSGNYLGFRQLLMNIQGYRFSRRLWDPYINTCLTTGLLKFRKDKQARYYIQKLRQRGLVPSIHILTLQLKLCIGCRRWDRGRTLVKSILKHDKVDRWAIFWAWKLSVKCNFYDMQAKLKELVKVREMNEEILWERPSKSRGLWVRRRNKQPQPSHIASKNSTLQGNGALLRTLDDTYCYLIAPSSSQVQDTRASRPEPDVTELSLFANNPTPSHHPIEVGPGSMASKWKTNIWKSILSSRIPRSQLRGDFD